MSTSQYSTDEQAHGGRSLVAVFPDREAARRAASQLQEDAFHHVWLGITHAAPVDGYASPNAVATRIPGETVVESASDSLGDKFNRFFTGETNERSLYDALVRHGVDGTQARRIEDQIPPETAILTVDGKNHPEAAASTIESCGGHVIAGESFATGTGEAYDDAATTASDTRRGSDILGYRDPNRYARGTEIDDERRLQLRSERLNVDKNATVAGEASIETKVVEHHNDLDVPVVHEELYVERRPASATAVDDTSSRPIGSNDVIRIPLMQEHVVVTKRSAVSGEYVIGKRAVTDTEHVAETTREEKLVVNGKETEL